MRKRLTRSATDRKLFGVLGGIARYFNIDSSILRIIFFAVVLLTLNIVFVFLYLGAAFIIPEE